MKTAVRTPLYTRWVLTLETGEVVIATFIFQRDFVLQTKSKTKAKLSSESPSVTADADEPIV